ncbi:anthranilate synthase family protein [Amycolatopsis sp. RTGN1]|uniref:anthranilate synthase family protein n=1 Tax=Amycolatopsis ponsaeliensis TaxID=2992142 RepID=UPI00254A2E05|nr:anthranilate synthase family protein [Amycolatopsis sp. RTGN1]
MSIPPIADERPWPGLPAPNQWGRRSFALLYRPESSPAPRVELLAGTTSVMSTYAELRRIVDEGGQDVLAVLPRNQDGAPLLALQVTHREAVPLETALRRLPAVAGEVTDAIEGFDLDRALAVFRHLLAGERGAYWTFLVHTGESTFVGASPERHISAHRGVVTMNPVTGTYRYPPAGPDLPSLRAFLYDSNEKGELLTVVDEALKTMSNICERGATVRGPRLREMRRLAHTEFLLTGRTGLPAHEVLRRSLSVPAATGGVLALFGRDPGSTPGLDSCVMIGTAEVPARGDVGATIVGDSDPEAAETRPTLLSENGEVRAALAQRRGVLSPFWLSEPSGRTAPGKLFPQPRVVLVDAEDSFTGMLGHQLAAHGCAVEIIPWSAPLDRHEADLVVVGTGPGDPRDLDNPRIAAVHRLTRALLSGDRPFLSACLGHQVLCAQLGLRVVRGTTPHQGVRKEIEFFGANLKLGFYNTFAALADGRRHFDGSGRPFRVSRDPSTGEVHGLVGTHWGSFQFHPESVLSRDGQQFLGVFVREILSLGPAGPTDRVGEQSSGPGSGARPAEPALAAEGTRS